MPNTWLQSAENTIELIIDQSWGAKPFTWKSNHTKCLDLSSMVSPTYVRLYSPYAVLIVCDMHLIVLSMLNIDGRGIPKRCKAKMVYDWTVLPQ